MSLLINTVLSTSSNVNYSYLETDSLFGYDVSVKYTIDVSDVQFTDNEGILFEGIEALEQAYLRKNLVARIGADEFINGRITSLSFGSSALVGAKEANITIEESKRLDSYSNDTFIKNLASPHLISSFQEVFNFSRSEDSYSYSRNVSIQYKQDAGDQFLSNAKFFLKNFYFTNGPSLGFQNRPNYGFQVDGISEDARFDSGFKPLISESYDLINLSVSLTENFESSKVQDNFSKKESYNLALLESGFLTKRYSIEIKALAEPLEIVANEACVTVIDGLIASNSASFSSPVSIEKGIDKDGGVISLSVEFTNDPSKNQTQTITYSASKQKRDLFNDYVLKIDFSSDGKNKIEKFQNSKENWQAFTPTSILKLQSLFPEASPVFEKDHSTSFDKEAGKISETIGFTDDPSYNPSGLPEGIIKLKITNTIKEQNERTFRFLDLYDLNEKITYKPEKTLGEGSFTIEIVSDKSKGLFFGQEYLETLSFLGVNEYKNSDVISIDSANGTTNRVISYVFTS